MAITKIQSESLNLSDNYDFTGTVTGAGESNVPYFNVKPSINIAYVDNVTHLVTLDTIVSDTASGFNNTASNYSYTIPSGQGGQWLINFGFRVNPTNANRINLNLLLNSETAISQLESDGGGGATYLGLQGSRILYLSAGDVLTCTFFQNSTVNSVLRTDGTFLCGFKLTATT